jgi:beta-glucanase (GH16 family)
MTVLLVVAPQPTEAATSCASSPSGQAMPKGDITGWHQVYVDDFNGSSLDAAHWGAYLGQPGGDALGYWHPSHVVVANCMATLKGYKDSKVKANLYVTGGIGMKTGQTYGKYLIRMRVDQGNGLSFIALLWPVAKVWPPEVDFYEDAGGIRKTTSATLHCGSNGKNTCRVIKNLAGYDFTKWHTLGVEWTPGKLVYTVDGKVWAIVQQSNVPSIAMSLDLQLQALVCTTYNTCVSATTPREVDAQIDWIVIYARK